MKHSLLQYTLLFFLVIQIASCSNNDDEQPCYETNVTMFINGEYQSFQAIGRGINLRSDGYELSINLDRRSNNPYREQTFHIELPYKQLGENIIEEFNYHQYIDQVSFNGDFTEGELQSNVISNNRNCFYATFSGTLSNGDQEITITDGELSYTYDDPFSE